ncbi:uncharacterized protein [Primulina eburnea]|uniref:uncharacterized protein n=1 Tax=Primulina eburnea TaxID=1245227 RepID=UPI003C6C92C2
MTHYEVSGRMVKWTIELGEYDIEYPDWISGNSPPVEKIKLALRIDSRMTNNEAKSETVLASMPATREAGAYRIILYSDSQLVTQQIKGDYEAKDERMLKYLKLILAQAESFVDWSIEHVPREENNEADALAKIAASLTEMSTLEIIIFTRLILSTEEESLLEIILGSLFKCLSMGEVDYVLREIHEESCGDHLGGVALARKAMLAGYWWPSMSQDSAQSSHSNEAYMVILPIRSVGDGHYQSLSNCSGSKKILLVAIDYFSKWVEAEPLAMITEKEVLKFQWKNIVCRFGVLTKLISDSGRKFQGREITSWCQEMKITRSFTSVAYPQANGQTEVVNRIIVQAFKTRLQGKGKDWFFLLRFGQSSARVESYPDGNDQCRAMELDMVEEKRERVMIRMESYRGQVMQSYNKRVRIRELSSR